MIGKQTISACEEINHLTSPAHSSTIRLFAYLPLCLSLFIRNFLHLSPEVLRFAVLMMSITKDSIRLSGMGMYGWHPMRTPKF
jgi:hypothetical protein